MIALQSFYDRCAIALQLLCNCFAFAFAFGVQSLCNRLVRVRQSIFDRNLSNLSYFYAGWRQEKGGDHVTCPGPSPGQDRGQEEGVIYKRHYGGD
jgi:hypothetical protein